jgi:hypothetical protein
MQNMWLHGLCMYKHSCVAAWLGGLPVAKVLRLTTAVGSVGADYHWTIRDCWF